MRARHSLQVFVMCIYVHVCVIAWRNTYSQRIVRQLQTEGRARTYAQQKTIRTSYIRLARNTEVGHNRKDPNFDNLGQFLKYCFHSFHFVTLKIQALLPFETSVAIYQPTWRYISKELKLNKHYGESCTIYMQRLNHVNDRLGLLQLSIQHGDLCADSKKCWLRWLKVD